MEKIKRLIAINVPVTTCNLRCPYCYITQTKMWDAQLPIFKYTPNHIGKALSKERLGGTCLINITGTGETLLPEKIVEIVHEILKQGHFIEIVTNGTPTKRFKQICNFEEKYRKRIFFKFSFHYLEFKRMNILDVFFNNVKMMKNAGCSYTVECTPTDELMPYRDEMEKVCVENLGAMCHFTIARADTNKNKSILTSLPEKEYIDTWGKYNSKMFDFKLSILEKKRKEFCYAGCWSLYVDLGTGMAKQCYGQVATQNIFKDISKPIKFKPIGKYCKQPYCYNGHSFLTWGVIPELKTPYYSEIRNKQTNNDDEWLTEEVRSFFNSKLVDSNKEYSNFEKICNTISGPFYRFPYYVKSIPLIIKRIKNK